MVNSAFLKNRQFEVCHVVPVFSNLTFLDWVDKMDTSSLEDPWKSQLATGPKHPHISIRVGIYHQVASNHIGDQKGFGEPGWTFRMSDKLVTGARSGRFTCLTYYIMVGSHFITFFFRTNKYFKLIFLVDDSLT